MAATAQQFVVSRSITRMLLARHCGLSASVLDLRKDARGKPYLEGAPRPIAFNVSHGGGFCALAVGDVECVGVDIEAVPSSADDLAESVFSSGEARQFAALPAAARLPALIRAWVAKEAYLKATGEGLGGGIDSLELDLQPDATIKPIAIRGSRQALSHWHFHGFDVDDRVFGAVAIKADIQFAKLNIRRLDVEDVLPAS